MNNQPITQDYFDHKIQFLLTELDKRFAEVDRHFAEIDKRFTEQDKLWEQKLEKTVYRVVSEALDAVVLPQLELLNKRMDKLEKRMVVMEVRMDKFEQRLTKIESKLDFYGDKVIDHDLMIKKLIKSA